MADINPWSAEFVPPAPVQAAPVAAAPVANTPPWDASFTPPTPSGAPAVFDPAAYAQSADRENMAGPEIKSQDTIYDKVNNDPKYAELNDAHSGAVQYALRHLGQIGLTSTDAAPQADVMSAKDGQHLDQNTVLPGSPIAGNGMSINPGKTIADWLVPDDKKQKVNELETERNRELTSAYENTGDATQLNPQLHIPFTNTNVPIMPEGLRPDIRTQTVQEPNPNFDGGHPGEFSPTVPHTYQVDPPTRDAAQRIGLQILKNGVMGPLDTLTQGKLLTPGVASNSVPDQKQDGAESAVATIGALTLGPSLGGPAYKAAVTGLAKLGPVGQDIARVAQTFSPEVKQVAAQWWKEAELTGGTAKAMAFLNKFTKKVIGGTALAVTTASMAPDGMQGIVSPKWISDVTGASPERAQDLSFLADTPIVGGALTVAGKAVQGTLEAVGSSVGGLRNKTLWGNTTLGDLLLMTDKQAGLTMYHNIDPNLSRVPSQLAANNIKLMGDLLTKGSSKELGLGGAKGDIPQDTATALGGVLHEYYAKAYDFAEDLWGTEKFNKWVDTQAQSAADRMTAIRTAGQTRPDVTKAGVIALKDLGSHASDNMAGGNLTDARSGLASTADRYTRGLEEGHNNLLAGQEEFKKDNLTKIGSVEDFNQAQRNMKLKAESDKVLQAGSEHSKNVADASALEGRAALDHADRLGKISDDYTETRSQAQLAREQAQAQVDEADRVNKTAQDSKNNAILLDGKDKDALYAAKNANPNNTENFHLDNLNKMGEPVYNSYKTLVNKKDAAYKAVGNTDAEGDPMSLLEILRNHDGELDKDGKVIYPQKLKDIGEALQGDDGANFGHIYNNVRKMVQDGLDRQNGPGPVRDTLLALRKNITRDQVANIKDASPEVAKLVEDAKKAHNDILTTYGDSDATKSVMDAADERMYKERFDQGHGPGQGVTDFNNTWQHQIAQHLNGPDRAAFATAMAKGTELGGNPIAEHLQTALIAKGMNNLATNVIDHAHPQTVGTVDNAFSGVMNGLERMNPDHPAIGMIQSMKKRIEDFHAKAGETQASLDNLKNVQKTVNTTAKQAEEDAKALKDRSEGEAKRDLGFAQRTAKETIGNSKTTFDQVAADAKTNSDVAKGKFIDDQTRTQQLKDNANEHFNEMKVGIEKDHTLAQKTLLNKFIYEDDMGKGPKMPGGVSHTIDSILDAKQDSGNKLKSLMDRADKMGAQGEVIKNAIKGSTIDHFMRNIEGNAKIGFDNLATSPIQVNRTNTRKARMMFESHYWDNLETVFGKDSDTIKELGKVKDMYTRLTATVSGGVADKALTRVARDENPEEAMGTVITLAFGVLNSTASKLRKFSGPSTVKDLESVRVKKADQFDKFINDPVWLGQRGQKLSETLQGNHGFGPKSFLKNAAKTVGDSVPAMSRMTSNAVSNVINGDQSHERDHEKNKVPEQAVRGIGNEMNSLLGR